MVTEPELAELLFGADPGRATMATCQRMAAALDSPEGRAVVARALATDTFAIDVLKAAGYRVFAVDGTDEIAYVERTGDGDE